MNVLLAGGGTGGHLMPALAIADALVKINPNVKPVLIGAERGVEASLLPSRTPAYAFHLLPFEPIYRRTWWRNLRWPIGAWKLRQRTLQVLEQVKPTVVVGTGGYVSGPPLFFAQRRGIPIVLQEQNAFPGLATRMLARRATEIYLGYEEASRFLRVTERTRVRVLGNPIVPPEHIGPEGKRAARVALEIEDATPVCFVTGGSQGAAGINEIVGKMIESGSLENVTLLWGTGHGQFERYRRWHHPPHRIVRPFWQPIATPYAAADLVVSRAGAMTTAELCAWGKPAILVPLPTAAADHQTVNAQALDNAGVACHVPQSSLTVEGFSRIVGDLIGDAERLNRMSAAALARGQPDAAAQIASHILDLTT